MSLVITRQIVENFSAMAHAYDCYAHVQRIVASRLVDIVQDKKDGLPSGAVVEIGAGTGLLSRQLPSVLGGRRLVLVDPSSSMLSLCRKQMEAFVDVPVTYVNLYSEQWVAEEPIALLVSSFSMQWYEDFCSEVLRLGSQLVPGGALAVAVPVCGSFSLWQELCEQEGVPSTINKLPTIEDLKAIAAGLNAQLSMQEYYVEDPSAQAVQFLRSLKGLGAHTRTSGIPLGAGRLRKILREADRRMKEGERFSFRVAIGWMQL